MGTHFWHRCVGHLHRPRVQKCWEFNLKRDIALSAQANVFGPAWRHLVQNIEQKHRKNCVCCQLDSVQCHSSLSGHKDFHELRFSIVIIKSLQVCLCLFCCHCICICIFVVHALSAHYYEQMSQRSLKLCLKCQKCSGSLCSVVISLIVSDAQGTDIVTYWAVLRLCLDR